MTDLEKNGLIGTLQKILFEVREIVDPDSVGLMDKSHKDKEHSEPHLAWLEKVKKAVEDLGLPPDEEDEDEEEEPEEDDKSVVLKIVDGLRG